MKGKWMPLSQHNKIVAEIIAERDRAIRERTMAERNNDILVRIREAKRGPLDKYVECVLDDAEAEIEAARLAAERDTPRTERDEAVVAMRQILGWRELRSGQEFPIDRIENIARAFLAKMEERGQ